MKLTARTKIEGNIFIIEVGKTRVELNLFDFLNPLDLPEYYVSYDYCKGRQN